MLLPFRRSFLSVCCLFFAISLSPFLLVSTPAFAQTPPPLPHKVVPKKTRKVIVHSVHRAAPRTVRIAAPRSVRIVTPRTRTIRTVAPRTRTVRTLSSVAKTKSGARTSTRTALAAITALTNTTVSVRLDKADKTLGSQLTLPFGLGTRFIKNNLPVSADAFQVGDKVAARFSVRAVSGGSPVLSLKTLYDADSYALSQHERKDICVGTVSKFTADAIEVKRRDGTLHTFVLSDKTLLRKGESAAGVGDYPAGVAVAVKPRGLPSGTLMASIVAESAETVEQVYQDGLIRWTGTITLVEPAASTLSLRRPDGALRKVSVAADAVIKEGRRTLKLADLTAGQTVRLHLIKGSAPNELRVADTVTIVTPRKSRTVAP